MSNNNFQYICTYTIILLAWASAADSDINDIFWWYVQYAVLMTKGKYPAHPVHTSNNYSYNFANNEASIYDTAEEVSS